MKRTGIIKKGICRRHYLLIAIKRYPLRGILRRSFLLILPVSILSLFLSSCARQGYPTGGPKDAEPPKSLSTRPGNGSHNFAANEFYIQFDEYVVLKNPTDNILVSPPMKQQPEYTTKGKGILVTLHDTLLPNTTYLFQFKEAIADFNEGNLLPSFEYVFSTGDTMDTLMLGGRVLEPRSGKPWKETVTVAAFKESAKVKEERDSAVNGEQPDFVTRCDKQGFFAFHHLPEGNYHLVAFEDKNRNLRLDSVEAAAWDTTAYKALPTVDSNRVATFFISKPETQRQRITSSAFTAKGHIQIVTQLPLQHPVVSGEPMEWRLNSRRDTLNIWCLNPKCDSTVLVVNDDNLQDTLRLRFVEKKKGSRQRANTKEESKPLMSTLCDGNKAFYDNLRLAFENPVVSMRDSAQAEIMYLKDSTFSLCPLEVDSSGLSARLMTSLKSGEQYRIRLRDSLFTDLYGRYSDSLTFTLTPKDYGILTLHVDNRTDLPLVIEVLDKRDTVVQHSSLITHHSPLTFSHLPAGEYRLRAILDANGDGRWTPGDYRLQRQPEQAIYFEKTLSLREKWEMEEHWIVEKDTNEKKLKLIERIPIKDLSPSGDLKSKPEK